MRKLGFGERFVRILETLYENNEARVLLNGIPGKATSLERGVRQGCPLVMLLYVIFIKKGSRCSRLGGEAYRVSAYVDNLAVVTDLNPRVMRTTADILDSFCRATNLVLNKMKTKSLKIGRFSGAKPPYIPEPGQAIGGERRKNDH